MNRQMGGRPMDRNMTPPVNVGEEMDVTIEGVGEKGDGIAKKRGFVIFVPKTQAGQNVKIKIVKVLKNLGFGEVIGEATSKPEEKQTEETTEGGDSEYGDSEVFTNQQPNTGESLTETLEESEDFGNDDEE